MFRFFTNTKSVIYEYSDYFGAPSGGFSMFGAFLGNGPADIIPATARAIVSPFNKLFDLFNNLITTIKTALGFGTKIVTAVTSLGGLISPMPNPGEIGMAAQRGGNPDDTSLNVLPFSLLGTLALIVLSGFALTYRRTKNGTIEQDDTPPEPGVFRKTNTKKSNPTA
jgi:hypothetical protein